MGEHQLTQWPESRLIAARYQTPFNDGIGFARYASSGTVTPEFWQNIRRIEADAQSNDPSVEGWGKDMKDLRAALKAEGIHESVYTVIGFWNDEDERHVIGVIEGQQDVREGCDVGEGGLFAVLVHAEDHKHAELKVHGTTTEDDVDEEGDLPRPRHAGAGTPGTGRGGQG